MPAPLENSTVGDVGIGRHRLCAISVHLIHCANLSISIFHILVAKSYSQQAGYVLVLSKRTGINSPWPLTPGVLDTLVITDCLIHTRSSYYRLRPHGPSLSVCHDNVLEIWTLDIFTCNFDSLRCEHSSPSHRPHVFLFNSFGKSLLSQAIA